MPKKAGNKQTRRPAGAKAKRRQPRNRFFQPLAPIPVAQRSVVYRNISSDICMRHTEILQSITAATGAMLPRSWYINPRNADTFKWLSKVAEAYDQFRIRSLSIRYEPACASTTEGTICMLFDYDIEDDNSGADIDALSAHAGATHGPVNRALVLNYNVSKQIDSSHKLICKSGNYDRFSAPARLWITATNPAPETKLFGKVYLSYVIDLIQPEVLTGSYAQLGRIDPTDLTDKDHPFGHTATNQVVSTLNTCAVDPVQAPNIQQFLGKLVEHPDLITKFMQFCSKNVVSMSAVMHHSRFTHENVWAYPNMAVERRVFEEDDDLTVLCINPNGTRYFTVFYWLRGTWTPDVAGSYPILRWITSDNLYCREYLPNDYLVNMSPLFPNVGQAIAYCLVGSVNWRIDEGETAWVTPYIDGSGTWVGTVGQQRIWATVDSSGAASQWDPQEEE